MQLAIFLKKHNIRPEQVQDFYPTPGTISTAMFWTGLDPYTMEPVFVPRTPEEKRMQRALLQYFKPENHDIVEKALIMTKHRELIGTGRECLISPSDHSRQRNAYSGGKAPQRNSAQRGQNQNLNRERGSVNGRQTAKPKKSPGKRRS